MKILFIDVDCPQPLDSRVVGRRPLGGTESTLFLVSDGLAATPGVEVTIAQHNREITETAPSGVRYIPYHHKKPLDLDGPPDAVVVLRNPKFLPTLRRAFPAARLLLWMHCFPGKRWRRCSGNFHRSDLTLVTVSDALNREMIRMMRPALPPWEAQSRVITIHNPISPAMPTGPVTRPFDPDKLVYFSSPHKGLDQVLEHFTAVRREFPRMRLFIADPGYWNGPRAALPEGVVALGALRPDEVHRHVAEALCVFYPQSRFAETFGLVFAEANALGTPVLAHPLGAAREVLDAGGPGQLTDCNSTAAVVETIRRWRAGDRPVVRGYPRFQLGEVVNQWARLLDVRPQKSRRVYPRDAA